jgi:serine/threonine-protein kinase RsbW
MTADPLPDDVIDVTVPLRAQYASTLRVLVAALGADAGFSIDEIDDVKLALTEAFSMMTDDQGNRRVSIRFSVDATGLSVRLAPQDGATIRQPDELARTILDVVVDRYEVNDESVTLTKRAVERAGNPAER